MSQDSYVSPSLISRW